MHRCWVPWSYGRISLQSGYRRRGLVTFGRCSLWRYKALQKQRVYKHQWGSKMCLIRPSSFVFGLCSIWGWRGHHVGTIQNSCTPTSSHKSCNILKITLTTTWNRVLIVWSCEMRTIFFTYGVINSVGLEICGLKVTIVSWSWWTWAASPSSHRRGGVPVNSPTVK